MTHFVDSQQYFLPALFRNILPPELLVMLFDGGFILFCNDFYAWFHSGYLQLRS